MGLKVLRHLSMKTGSEDFTVIVVVLSQYAYVEPCGCFGAVLVVFLGRSSLPWLRPGESVLFPIEKLMTTLKQ
jgi:hypothetical protein